MTTQRRNTATLTPVFTQALGEAFAGSYIDDNGRLAICVLGEPEPAAITVKPIASELGVADAIVVRQVRHSAAELDDLTHSVARYLGRHYPAASWSFAGSIVTQNVVAHVFAPNSAEIKIDVEAAYAGRPAIVEVATEPGFRT